MNNTTYGYFYSCCSVLQNTMQDYLPCIFMDCCSCFAKCCLDDKIRNEIKQLEEWLIDNNKYDPHSISFLLKLLEKKFRGSERRTHQNNIFLYKREFQRLVVVIEQRHRNIIQKPQKTYADEKKNDQNDAIIEDKRNFTEAILWYKKRDEDIAKKHTLNIRENDEAIKIYNNIIEKHFKYCEVCHIAPSIAHDLSCEIELINKEIREISKPMLAYFENVLIEVERLTEEKDNAEISISLPNQPDISSRKRIKTPHLSTS